MKFYTQLALSIAAITATFFSYVSAECPNACRCNSIFHRSLSVFGKKVFFLVLTVNAVLMMPVRAIVTGLATTVPRVRNKMFYFDISERLW